MKPFTKILVPVDFSPHSSEAIRVASDLASKYAGSVSLVYVWQPVNYSLPEGYVLYTANQLTDLLQRFEKELQTAKQLALEAGAKQVDTKLLEGTPASEIVSHAEKGGYNLIVMGTHGRTGVSHALLGSVAEKVVRKAPCPVLSVHL